MLVLGLMSGTSLDGVDAVWTDISGTKKMSLKMKAHKYTAYPKALRQRLLAAAQGKASSYDVGELNHELGRFYALIASASKLKPALVGLHGQTIYHRGQYATLQIGEPSYLAQALRCPVIFNFRAADIASQGQGAPLAPIFHQFLLQPFAQKGAAFHNLGGISNTTVVSGKTCFAFDTGPASILIDAWIDFKTNGRQKMDRNGNTAQQGLADSILLKKFLSHPYFKKSFPKSCGREEFNLEFIKKYGGVRFSRLSLENQSATLTELTAHSIADAYKNLRQQPQIIFFSGGGVYNQFLMQRLKIHLTGIQIRTSQDLGWPAETIEAGAFATLAYLRWQKQKIDLKKITGGTKNLLGQICEF